MVRIGIAEMRRLLALGIASMWSVTTQAGILPEFNQKSLAKKQPSESYNQQVSAQSEEAAVKPVQALPVATAVLGPREAALAAQYTTLGARSGGQFYNALDKPLVTVLDDLLHAQLVEGADIVFLVDHTISMEDDIDEIRSELKQLIATFSKLPGVRVGIVTFSDVKSGSKFGFYAHPLSDRYDGLEAFLQGVELLGSIEDVYGAIYKVVEQFEWKSPTKRLIVIISDEKPATGKDTNYTEEEVLAKCAQHGVKTNLYPVLVDKYLPVKQ